MSISEIFLENELYIQTQILLLKHCNVYYPTQLRWQNWKRRNDSDTQNQWAIRPGGGSLNTTKLLELWFKWRTTPRIRLLQPLSETTTSTYLVEVMSFKVYFYVKGTIIFSVNYLWIFTQMLLIFLKGSKRNILNRKKEIGHSTFLGIILNSNQFKSNWKIPIKEKYITVLNY